MVIHRYLFANNVIYWSITIYLNHINHFLFYHLNGTVPLMAYYVLTISYTAVLLIAMVPMIILSMLIRTADDVDTCLSDRIMAHEANSAITDTDTHAVVIENGNAYVLTKRMYDCLCILGWIGNKEKVCSYANRDINFGKLAVCNIRADRLRVIDSNPLYTGLVGLGAAYINNSVIQQYYAMVRRLKKAWNNGHTVCLVFNNGSVCMKVMNGDKPFVLDSPDRMYQFPLPRKSVSYMFSLFD